MERKAAQQNKNLSEELKQGYLGTAQVNKVGGVCQNTNIVFNCRSVFNILNTEWQSLINVAALSHYSLHYLQNWATYE